MVPERRPTVERWERPAYVAWIKFAWIAVLMVSCYFMGQSMFEHHFFDGGVQDNRIENLRY